MTTPLDDVVYMNVAKIMKRPSEKKSNQVGACIVDPSKNVIVSSGSHNRVVHAPTNAIMKKSSDIKDCVMYTTCSPCNECAKVIIQSKITKVIYLDDQSDLQTYGYNYEAGKLLLVAALGDNFICHSNVE